jgi:ERCC4-type nuclease
MKKIKYKDYDLITDTREQNPLPFRKTISKKLDFGDYGAELDGELLPVVFERKSPQDLWSTITTGHDRFKEEIGRACDSGFKLIVIVECSYKNFIDKKFEGSYHSNLPVFVVTKILHKLQVRYNLEFVFCNDRSEACNYVRNYFNALSEEYQSLYKP